MRARLPPVLLQNGLNRFEGNPAALRAGSGHRNWNDVFHDEAAARALPFATFAHVQDACELLALRRMPINWGPVRHGPGHNVAIYHRNFDDQNIEFYIEIDQMRDEELGYFEPRPWHRDTPQRPKIWDRKDSPNLWGPMPTPDYMR